MYTETDEKGQKTGVSIGRNRRKRSEDRRKYRKKQSRHERKKNPDCILHPNQNIIINKIYKYFIRY